MRCGKKELGRAIERLRLQAGISGRELAARAGLRPGRLASYEAGVTEPRWKTVERLLLALGTGPGAMGRALEEVTGRPLDELDNVAAVIRLHQDAAGLLLRVLERWPEYVERRRWARSKAGEGEGGR